MSWFKLPKDNPNSLFNKILRKYYQNVRITKEQSLKVKPDVDELNDYDTDLVRDGLIPVTDVVDSVTRTKTKEGVVAPTQYSRIRKRIPIPKERRQMVFIRCNNICEVCEDHSAQQIHHADGNPRNNDYDNLLAVCYDCHKEIEKVIRIRIRGKKEDEFTE